MGKKKKNFFRVLPIYLCFLIVGDFLAPLAKAEEIHQEGKEIITSGEAKIWIEPDRARIFLGIETLRERVEIARQENAKKIKKLMEALKALNIEGMLIKAPSYNVTLVKEPEYVATKTGRLPKTIGYKVVREFTILLKNKDLLVLSKNAGRIIDTALDNGVNIIKKVYFFKEDDSQDKRRALRLAVKDAISNAKAIAKAAGVSIKGYTLINSFTGYWRPPVVNQMHQAPAPGEGGGADTILVAGKIAITCKVQLHCIIE